MHASSPHQRSEATVTALDDELVDALMTASRALVAIAARSLDGVDDKVSLPQYRALVVLAGHGPQRVSDLAGTLEIHQSTTSRLCDRLADRDLVERRRSPESRREVFVALTEPGRTLVAEVTKRRRVELRRVALRVADPDRPAVAAAFHAFAEAAGELPDDAWRLGWA